MASHLLVPSQIVLSIGILARNEEARLPVMLASLFQQTVFAELLRRGTRAEIWCVANACTDNTAAVAERIFREQSHAHPAAPAFLANAVSVATPGKTNAWNLFVHEISDRETHYLILLDADIQLGSPDTLWQLCEGLERDADARISVGRPIKDVALKAAPTPRERLSLTTAQITRDSGPQVTGQLYCIRAETARRIRLPRDLGSCEDGFIKNLVCTDFLRAPSDPARVRFVPEASHVFEAYLSTGALIRNQKRQMIGQTCVHLLLDRVLPNLDAWQDTDLDLAQVVTQLDEEDPEWLRRLVVEHARRVPFWQLFPGICTFRFRRWARGGPAEKLRHFPATLAGSAITVIAAWLAHRALRRGFLGYWPIKPSSPSSAAADRPLAAGLKLARQAPA